MKLRCGCRPAMAAAAAPASGARSSCRSGVPMAATAARAAACGCGRSEGINTLADFRIERVFKARSGEGGSGNGCTGRSGEDLYVAVPVGTVVRDAETEEPLGDLVRAGQELKVAQGGKGGWGNTRFKSSTNRAPRQFGPGLPGREAHARARAQGHRRCWAAGAAECRQIDADPRGLGGAATRWPTIRSRRCIRISAWSTAARIAAS